MMDMLAAPETAQFFLERTAAFQEHAAVQFARAGVDIVITGDDVAGQKGLLLSRETWREFLKPRLSATVRAVKAVNPATSVLYHSDGNVEPIIPELIEIGIDVLNPIQPAAMDPVKLKAEYGDKLCFWGSMDIQQTLPFGTPEEVRAEVLTRLGTIGRGGGLIIGPTHNLQLDTPLENFWAMVDAIRNTPYNTLQ